MLVLFIDKFDDQLGECVGLEAIPSTENWICCTFVLKYFCVLLSLQYWVIQSKYGSFPMFCDILVDLALSSFCLSPLIAFHPFRDTQEAAVSNSTELIFFLLLIN